MPDEPVNLLTPEPPTIEIPPLDMSPFRTGTVWHYALLGFMVVWCEWEERVRHYVDRMVLPPRVVVEPAEAKMRMHLERADWADGMPMERTLPDGPQRSRSQALTFGANSWFVIDINRVFVLPPIGIPPCDLDPVPAKLEVALLQAAGLR